MDKMENKIFLHLLQWNLLKKGGHYFLSGKEEERGETILSSLPPQA